MRDKTGAVHMQKNDKIWTRAQLDKARDMFVAGHSAAEISGQVGKSRSAVIGKIKRLGLTRKDHPTTRNTKQKTTNVKNGTHGTDAVPDVPPAPPPPFVPKVPVLLAQLRREHCRAIIGDVGPDGFAWYCGDPKAEGSSWCVHHHGLYLQPPKPKEFYGKTSQR